ncbi:hypothetical protein EST38_g7243 [Candolleomyces aberdarensis]|uniref:Uncharacterized protein n=1 Tax=Candolleomyces aberdarensis TaxID=2316362 RepID=A0A4Q2DHH3_9AGAR|nr:hypothetical protein EST38_g7243 [Candolleomyces aberdarensis]
MGCTPGVDLGCDSVAEAKCEGRKKVSNGDGKAQLFNKLAEVIFKADNINTKTQEDYLADPKRYAKSTQQQFSRLKKKYGEVCAQFKETGGGSKAFLTQGSDAANLEAEILQDWPFYANLHVMWSELPNYNPVVASLFEKPSKPKKSPSETLDDADELLEDGEGNETGRLRPEGEDDPSSDFCTTEDDNMDPTLVSTAEALTATATVKPEPSKVKSKATNVKTDVKPTKLHSYKSGKGKKRPYTNSSDFDGLDELEAIELKEESK